jgi:hypothetical protein
MADSTRINDDTKSIPRALGGTRAPVLSAMERQPEKLDFASPTQFRFLIKQLPKVEFFNVSANLPGISMSASIQQAPTIGRDIPIHGDKVAFEEFTMSFMVDEYLENYKSLWDWIIAIGFPSDKSQFTNWAQNESVRMRPTSTSAAPLFYADASLIILSNKNNPIVEVTFQDMFPLTLSGLEYSQNATDVEYMQATATFAYQIYDIKSL